MNTIIIAIRPNSSGNRIRANIIWTIKPIPLLTNCSVKVQNRPVMVFCFKDIGSFVSFAHESVWCAGREAHCTFGGLSVVWVSFASHTRRLVRFACLGLVWVSFAALMTRLVRLVRLVAYSRLGLIRKGNFT